MIGNTKTSLPISSFLRKQLMKARDLPIDNQLPQQITDNDRTSISDYYRVWRIELELDNTRHKISPSEPPN